MIIEFDKDISKIKGRRFSFTFEIKSDYSFLELTIDIYPVENPMHPQRHFAYWVFEKIFPGKTYKLVMSLENIERNSLYLEYEGERIYPEHFWANENGFYEPIFDFQFVLRKDGKIKKILHSQLILGESEEIERFYTHDRGGEYKIDTLNLVFHNHRLKLLKKIFKKYIKDSKTVLDAGSGISVFSLLYDEIPYKVFAVDLKFDGLIKRGRNITYIKANVENLPFKNEFFDFSYSGEVIEHLYSPLKFLKEVNRVTKRGGAFVITTPNSDRLINRVRGFKIPLSREHVNEMNMKELEVMLGEAGFEIVEKKGIYVEFFLNYFRKENVYDIFQAKLNRPFFKPIMGFLMKAGEFFPSIALDMVVVSFKK